MTPAPATGMTQLSGRELLLLLLLPISSWSECIPNPRERSADYIGCPAGRINNINITQTTQVPSVSYCSSLCLELATCSSFNIQQDANSNYQCQLSSFKGTNCTTTTSVSGTRSYLAKPKVYKCHDQWRVALKTEGSTVVKGSLDALREAVLSGAKVNVLWEPYPLSSDVYLYHGQTYVLDTIKVQEAEPLVTGHIYTYRYGMHGGPLWEHLTVDTSGALETFMSNGSSSVSSSNTLTWVVQGVTSECFQRQALSHKGAVRSPALTVVGTEISGEVSDVISVLKNGSTMSMISSLGDKGTFAYPTYALTMIDRPTADGLLSMSTWIPGDGTNYIPLRVHMFDFRSDSSNFFERYTEHDTIGAGSSDQFFEKDPALAKTEVFLDPCWELKLSIDNTGRVLEGSKVKLFLAIQSGARLLLQHINGSQQNLLEAEEIQLFTYGYLFAKAKMGVPSEGGYKWVQVEVTTLGNWTVGSEPALDPGPRNFYTDTLDRPFKYAKRYGSEINGTWSAARERLQSGLVPRAMVQVSDSETHYLDIEYVNIKYQYWNVELQSYRSPRDGGFLVYQISLYDYWRADVGLYRSYGDNIKPEQTSIIGFSLFFQDWPVDPE